MRRPLPALTLAALTTIALAGCPSEEKTDLDSGDSGQLDCTTEARASVQLIVVDGDGAPVADPSATYDAGTGPQPCEPMPDGVLVCGWEVAGPLQIRIEADGFAEETLDIVVESDVCHVITAQVEVALTPLD